MAMRKRKKVYRLRIDRIALIGFALITLILLVLRLALKTSGVAEGMPEIPEAAVISHQADPPEEVEPTEEPPPPVDEQFSAAALHSAYALLTRSPDGMPLLNKDGGTRMYPASMTKIMTALVVLESLGDLQEKITLPESIYPDLYSANASMAGFQPGEEVAAIDLLYGALLPSGAEASTGLAIRVAGTVEGFVEQMNQKAASLGMEGTHYANVTGLYDPAHYSTAADTVALLQYALQNGQFRDMFTCMRYSTGPTNLHPDGITVSSTLTYFAQDFTFPGGEILGGKTGYTEESGLCLASLARKNGVEYILVTSGAMGDGKTEAFHLMDAMTVYGEYLL